MSGSQKGKGRQQARANRGRDEREFLANAFRFEQEKNKILLDEVIALEDALVNRQMGEFDAVISDETRDFWREQLLSNREKAETALRELVQAKSGGSEQGAVGSGRRRPLHNRATARPVPPGVRDGEAEGKAVKIRNRAHALCKAEGIPFSTAFRRAEKEICGE
jgi:hypothetical protein